MWFVYIFGLFTGKTRRFGWGVPLSEQVSISTPWSQPTVVSSPRPWISCCYAAYGDLCVPRNFRAKKPHCSEQREGKCRLPPTNAPFQTLHSGKPRGYMTSYLYYIDQILSGTLSKITKNALLMSFFPNSRWILCMPFVTSR